MGVPKKVHEVGADGGEAIVLSERDFKLIMDAHENPRDLGPEMKKAWREYQDAVRTGRLAVEDS